MVHVILKPKEQKLIRVTAPFIDEISGLAIVKILDGGTHSTLLIKLKFICNAAIIDMVNNGTETMIFGPEEMLGIVNLRLLGYYKMKQGILQQNISKYYRFEIAEKLCKFFNNFVNTLKKEREKFTRRNISMVRPWWWTKVYDRSGNIRQIHRSRKFIQQMCRTDAQL